MPIEPVLPPLPAAPGSWVGIGQMSGSSLDGVDLAAVSFAFDGRSWHHTLLAAETYPYPADWYQRLVAAPGSSAEDYAKLSTDYGHYLGLLIRRFQLEAGITADFVALHGHTVFHQPWRHFTAAIGEGEVVASHVAMPVVSQLRVRDVALGGQGAPMVPLGEWHLFPDMGLFLNLGGIANLSLFRDRLAGSFEEATWLKPGWRYLSYDVAACNSVLNTLAQQAEPSQPFDKDGALAAAGAVDAALLAVLDGMGYYHHVPPRSLSREIIEAEVWPLLRSSSVSVNDQLATWCAHLAGILARELNALGVGNARLLVTGGGAHNTHLVGQLRAALQPLGISVEVPSARVIDFKEALIFAFLGLHRLVGLPTVLPGATGSRTASSTGALHLPTGSGWLR